MEQAIIMIAAVAGMIGAALGFLACASVTAGKTEGLLDEIDELEDKLTKITTQMISAEADRDHYKAKLARLTDRDARGRFVRSEV